jgi:hypothetical protein
MLSSAIVFSSVKLVFANSTLPEISMAASISSQIYTTSVDSIQFPRNFRVNNLLKHHI